MTSNTPTSSFIQDVRRQVYAKVPIVHVVTFEDQRCENQLKDIAAKGFQKPFDFKVWTSTQGLCDSQGKAAPETQDPEAMLDALIQHPGPGIFFLKDLHHHLENPQVLRKLRDVYQAFKSTYKTLLYSAPSPMVPEGLSKEITMIAFQLPDVAELEQLLDQNLKSFSNAQQDLAENDREDLIKSALGMTMDEARQAYQMAFVGRKVINTDCIRIVIAEKCKVVQKEGILEYIDIDFNMDEIGGLKNLKNWLEERSKFFSKNARDYGISPPKGILLTGISGCGKSSCVKAISQYWRLPLMRLDMTKVYGGTMGNPEETMRRALQTVEAVAPVILWIEEIEKGVAGFAQGDGGVTARIFSSFLTWMQEKKSLVFVAATANEIDKLPPELLRKGRFDEIFFTDLPTESERLDIFKVHIKKRKQDPAVFKLGQLAKATSGFSGAEIEQVVASGMYKAFNESRKFNDQDLYVEISRTIPLATTMAEQIKTIKRWADTRAVKASAPA